MYEFGFLNWIIKHVDMGIFCDFLIFFFIHSPIWILGTTEIEYSCSMSFTSKANTWRNIVMNSKLRQYPDKLNFPLPTQCTQKIVWRQTISATMCSLISSPLFGMLYFLYVVFPKYCSHSGPKANFLNFLWLARCTSRVYLHVPNTNLIFATLLTSKRTERTTTAWKPSLLLEIHCFITTHHFHSRRGRSHPDTCLFFFFTSACFKIFWLIVASVLWQKKCSHVSNAYCR